ncbi:hypothetical protein Tco_1378755 [Tanacetum coccineum]
MAQHVIPAAQLVPQYKSIERYNNYVVLQSIPCSPECKIVRQILLDHPLNYALTATVDVPAVYLQQFWRTVSKVPDSKDTIKFLLDTQPFTYTVDMFRDTLHLPVETPNTPFVAPKKEAIQYPRFIKLIIADLMKKFPNIPKRLEEDYHSIKDDVPLVSVYTTGNVLARRMLIPDAFLSIENRETNDFKEYETVFMKVDVPMNQPQSVISTQGSNRITPSAHRSPTIFASPLKTKKRKQIARESSSSRKSLKVTIKQKEIVDAEKDDVDSEDRLEPGSHKENLEVVDDDDDNELMDIVSIPITTTFKHSQVKKRISSRYSYLPGALRRMFRRQAETIIEDRDAFRSDIPAFFSQEFKTHAPKIIIELFKEYVQSNVIHVHPTIISSTTPDSSADLQYQLYLKMKSSLQDRADNITLWEALRRKFEKSSTSNTYYREDDFHSYHDEHQDNNAPPGGEKRVKRRKKSKRSKSARGSSSKHSRKDSTTYVFK